MKKIIIIALAVLLCGSAYASKFEVTGSAVMKGKYWNNYDIKEDPAVKSLSYYDFDFNIYPKFIVDENNFAALKCAIKDIAPGVSRTSFSDQDTDGNEDDENIAIERAYFQTKIGPTALSLGLMDGGAWATDFGNSTSGVWRIKTVTTTPVGAVLAIIQKNSENSEVTNNTEDDDVYYLAMVTKAGPMFIKPLLVYADLNKKKAVKTAYQLGLDGKFGDISLEAEFGYQAVEGDDSDVNDYSNMGAYVHVSMAMGDNTAGFMFLYGSTDTDENPAAKGGPLTHGYGFGDDAVYLTILDDEKEYGNTDLAGAGGLTVIALYYSAKVSDKLTVTPKFGYVMSNYDEGDNYLDDGSVKLVGTLDTAMELDIDCAYKINDAVTYNVALAYATQSNFSGSDPDAIWTLQHNVKISF